MPSVHVAWALLVGFGAVMVSSSRARWLVLAHPIVTILVVVATGNHFWLDGVVAAVLLGVALFAQRWSPIEALRQSGATPAPAGDAPAPAGAEPRDLAPSPVTTSSVAAEPAS
jgi:PAP2 superfamily